jgi:hypothetical protein
MSFSFLYGGYVGYCTCHITAVVLICAENFLVFGLVVGTHVPLEPILESRCIVFVFYPLELLLTACQRRTGLHQVGFGFRDQPLWKRLGDFLIFLYIR